MKQLFIALLIFVAGLAAGWWWSSTGQTLAQAPDGWIARIGNTYIDADEYVDAMRRRGGHRPGQYHDLAQKEQLLEALLYRKALAAAAVQDGLDAEPEVRRSLERILVNSYVAQHLRPRQENATITDEDIERIYQQEADDYAIPARRRVAMVHIKVAESAEESAREAAREKAIEAYQAAKQLDAEVTHFGAVAREYSQDQSSRYRGGVIGWIGEDAPERYRHDPAVIETANSMFEPGTLSGVIEGAQGFYLVRLVEYQPERSRPLEELQAGIRQRLLRDHYRSVEDAFRQEMLARFETDIRRQRLADIEPLGPPGPEEQRPPQGPSTALTRS